MNASEDCHPERRPQAEVEGPRFSQGTVVDSPAGISRGRNFGPWPLLILLAVGGALIAAIFGNLPVLLFMAAGLLIVLRFAYRTFLRPYLRAQRMRRAREARAFREAAKLPPQQ